MIQDVYIIGATGKVGKTLVRQIFEWGDTDAAKHLNPTRIVGLASSSRTIYSPDGISSKEAFSFTNRETANAGRYENLFDILNLAKSGFKNDKSSLVFVDVTALHEPMSKFHLHVMEKTPYGIVTANKNPIALSSYNIFQRLTHDIRRYGYRCSVMAGAQAVPFIQDLRDVNDQLRNLRGCFSGTLGYITTQLEKGIQFSEVLQEAVKRGYTEPHPRDDLSGLDVARKLIVLARTAGFSVGLNDVKLEPFIPSEYLQEDDIGAFMDSSTKLDEHFHVRMSNARSRGNTLRYVAALEVLDGIPEARVSLTEVPKISPLGNLESTLNALIVTTRTHPQDKPYLIQSQGAGLEITAQNIRTDLLQLLRERKNMIEKVKLY